MKYAIIRIVCFSGAALVVAVLAGCMSLSIPVAALNGGTSGSNQSAQQSTTPATTDTSNATASSGSGSGSTGTPSPQATMSYKYQFSGFSSLFWAVGWYGASYQPGQGTVWQFTTSHGSQKTMTLERALLKINADNTQWWHFRLDNGNKSFVYEFLVNPADKSVSKVRFRDPQSNGIGEFVPDQSNPQPAYGPTGMTPDQVSQYVTGQQSIQVQAGTFTADHILYTDQDHGYKVEAWASKDVPGGLIKSISMNVNNNSTSTTELVKIESGVATELGSY